MATKPTRRKATPTSTELGTVKIDKVLFKPMDDFIENNPENRTSFGSKILRSRNALASKAVQIFLTEHAEKPKAREEALPAQ